MSDITGHQKLILSVGQCLHKTPTERHVTLALAWMAHASDDQGKRGRIVFPVADEWVYQVRRHLHRWTEGAVSTMDVMVALDSLQRQKFIVQNRTMGGLRWVEIDSTTLAYRISSDDVADVGPYEQEAAA